MAYNPNPRLVDAIRTYGGDLAPLLLATTLVESGGRLDAVGDGGMSIGPYQMHSRGRGYNVPPAKRMDPVFSTKSAVAEFRRFAARGLSGPELAYSAQRPADRSGYIAKISAALPEAQRILGGMPDSVAKRSGGRANDLLNRVEPPGGSAALPPIGAAQGAPDVATAQRNFGLAAIGAINSIGQPGGAPPSALLGLAAARSDLDAAKQATAAIRKETARRQGQPAAPANAPAPPGQQQADPYTGERINGLVPIMPGKAGGFSTSGDPEGQSGGHRAVDWFGEHGTPTRSPVAGKIVRITDKGGGPFSGQVFGGTLGIRGNDGRLYVMRHIDPLSFRVGARVAPGQHVGTPVQWAGSDHVHFEVYPPGGSDTEYSTRALNPAALYGWA